MIDHAIDERVRTTCELCPAGCGVIVELRNGVPLRVIGDPDYPVNKGELCAKGKASLEYLEHPDRLRHPLKRVGRRGEGKWQQISWDEAFQITAEELTKVKDRYTANGVVFIRGYTKGYKDNYSARFANVFGSPNIVSCANICYQPRTMATNTTFGCGLYPDYETTSCIVMWGVNAQNTSMQEHVHAMEAIERGAKLIVIDPAPTTYAKSADIWIRPRPCTDLALALGMINVVISEGLYDSQFVEEWTVGFEELKSHVASYTPEEVEAITWVPAETIREAARLYATCTPGCIAWGNGLDNNFNN
jgi:anaerobic selenocysteine-containing dehydrogenase